MSRVKFVDHGRVLELSAMKETLQDEVGDGRMEGEALRDACGDVDVSVPLDMRDLIAALLVWGGRVRRASGLVMFRCGCVDAI